MEEILVSISCVTFNHENYIKDALDGFIMQKVDFAYEILIHDDASTDKTVEIIKEYEAKYPHLIKAIYQTENQYSKGIKVSKFNHQRAKGKYIAVCEGDDYWTDPLKLQKQVDYMRTHEECALCVHAGYLVDTNKKPYKNHVRPHIGHKIFTVDEIITSGGRLFVTNSVLYKREKMSQRPKFYDISPVGDYPMMIFLALQGTVYYIDDFMSAYRIGLTNSWTTRTFSDAEQTMKHYERTMEMLDELNRFTNYAYNDVIEKRKNQVLFNIHIVQNRFDIIKNPEFSEYFNQLDIFQKAKLHVRQHYPKAYIFLQGLKRKQG